MKGFNQVRRVLKMVCRLPWGLIFVRLIHSTRYWSYHLCSLKLRIQLTSHSRWSWMLTGSGGGWVMPGYRPLDGSRRDTWNTRWIAFHFEGRVSLIVFFETMNLILKCPSFFSESFEVGLVVQILQALSHTWLPMLNARGWSQSLLAWYL